MADRHATKPKAVRLPDGLEARVKEALAAEETVNGFIVAAIEREVERRSGGSTAPVAPPRARKPRADAAPPARFESPCPHPKARINKGLCGACGTNVGTRG